MWVVASIPFWILGIFFLYSAGCAVCVRIPGETRKDQVARMLIRLLFSGIALSTAAKIAS